MKKLDSILLLDDSNSTNLMNKELILSLNLAEHVEMVENGQQALDYICCKGSYNGVENIYPKPDLIITDINMPKMDGLKFLEQLKKINKKYKSSDGFVIAMLTQSFSFEKYDESKDGLGAKDFLIKPLNKESLMDIWDKYID